MLSQEEGENLLELLRSQSDSNIKVALTIVDSMPFEDLPEKVQRLLNRMHYSSGNSYAVNEIARYNVYRDTILRLIEDEKVMFFSKEWERDHPNILKYSIVVPNIQANQI